MIKYCENSESCYNYYRINTNIEANIIAELSSNGVKYKDILKLIKKYNYGGRIEDEWSFMSN